MSLSETFAATGLLGLFLASFLGHLTIIFKDVFFVPLLFHIRWSWHPLILGLIGGLGGGVGDLGIYLMGRGVGKITGRDEEKAVPLWIKKLGLLGVFISSLTPLPDAPILMLMGSFRFSIAAILALEVLGKTVLYTLTVMAGRALDPLILRFFPYPWDSIMIFIASVTFTFLVSWKRSRSILLSWLETVRGWLGKGLRMF